MRKLLKQKKGELTDVFIFLITIFILAVGLFVMIYIIPSITSGLKTAGMNSTNEGNNAIASLEQYGSQTINYGFMLIFVGLLISTLITSFMVRTHSIFLFLYIFFLAISILLSFYLGNAYHTLIDNPVFASTLSSATFITLIMEHIAEITLAVGALSMIVVFAKFSSFGGSQQQF